MFWGVGVLWWGSRPAPLGPERPSGVAAQCRDEQVARTQAEQGVGNGARCWFE